MLEASIDLAIWEKMHNESSKAYAAFLAYRNLSPFARSIKKACETALGTATAGKIRQWQVWSSKYKWIYRTSQWDIFVENQETEEHIKKIKEMNARHLRIAQALQQKAITRLSAVDPIEMTVRDVIEFLEKAIKLERLALGEAEEIRREDINISVADFTQVSTEKLRQLLGQKLLQLTEGTIDGEFTE